MSAQQSDLPGELLSSEPDHSMQRQVIRRATQLCRRAEPHAVETPCPAHVNEANRQLLERRG